MVFGIGKNAIVTDLCDVGFARGNAVGSRMGDVAQISYQ
jgi:hypothetical protein